MDSRELSQSISAIIDNNWDEHPDCDFTAQQKEDWHTYHLIGDVLRSKELAINSSDLFMQRMCKALAAEEQHRGANDDYENTATGTHSFRSHRFSNYLKGGASALAAVTLVSLVFLQVNPISSSHEKVVAQSTISTDSQEIQQIAQNDVDQTKRVSPFSENNLNNKASTATPVLVSGKARRQYSDFIQVHSETAGNIPTMNVKYTGD